MVTRVSTVAFEGIEARAVDVQVQISPGSVAFTVVGLPDKAVGESRERVRSALVFLRARPAQQADHGESGASRSAKGGKPLRPADRARCHGRDRGDSGRCAGGFHRAGGARARRFADAGRRRVAGGDGSA